MKTLPSPNPLSLQLFSIRRIELVQEPYGEWWLAVETECGHTIGARPFFAKDSRSDDDFCIVVARDGATVRKYSGGVGSPAWEVFSGFEAEYFGFQDD